MSTDLKNVKNEDGTFQHYAWPGGYPLYYVDNENNVLCSDCANEEDVSTEVVEYDVNWEDAEMLCDDCGYHVESAYADDDVPIQILKDKKLRQLMEEIESKRITLIIHEKVPIEHKEQHQNLQARYFEIEQELERRRKAHPTIKEQDGTGALNF
jgi:hypothetical protein